MAQKTDILLVMAPPWGVDMPPLGLAFISSYLERKGMRCSVIDLNARIYSRLNEERRSDLWNTENIRCWAERGFFEDLFHSLRPQIKLFMEEMRLLDPPVVGFSVNRSNILFSLELARLIKQDAPGRIVVFGGASCWARDNNNIPFECRDIRTKRLAFSPGIVDVFAVADGEDVCLEIIRRVRSGESLKGLPQAVVHLGEGIYSDPVSQADEEYFLKAQPPTFEGFELGLYTEKKLPVLFSRGCFGRCVFCNDWGMSGKYRVRKASAIWEEIKHHVDRYGIHRFHCCDLLLNGDLRLLEEFSDMVISSGYEISWSGQALVREDMSDGLLEKMKRAGCDSLVFGIESFSDAVLRRMGKSFDSLQAQQAIRKCHKAGIKAAFNVIVGFPGETEDDFMATVEGIRLNRDHIDCLSSISTCVLTPGSELSINADKLGISKSGSDNYSHWEMADGSNDYSLRKGRLMRLVASLKQWGLPYLSTNLYDEEFGKLRQRIGLSGRHAGTDVLLAICPCWGVSMPPLGMAYVASFLEKRCGIGVDILDLNVSIFNRVDDELKKLWQFHNSSHWTDKDSFGVLKERLENELDLCAETVLKHPCRIAAFSVYSTNRFFTIEVIRRIRAKDKSKIIVIGGRGCVNEDSRRVFDLSEVDVFIEGEGELCMAEVARKIRTRGEISDIPGAVFCRDGNMLSYRSSLCAEDITSLPFPDYKGFILWQYAEQALPMLMSRGCIGRCSFCDDYRLMGRYRVRKAEHVLEELIYHMRDNGINDFYFSDAALNGDLRELESLCDGIIKERLKLRWIALAIPRKEMTGDLLGKMKAAGCRTLNYGVETGSDAILSLMRKRLSISDVETVLRDTRGAGIITQLNFVVGFPGEGEDEFKETLDFIRRNKAWISGVTNINACNVLLNSDLFENSRDYGIVFPSELWRRDTGWHTGSGNDYAVRSQRVEKVISLLNELGIPMITSNLQEKEADLSQL